MKILGIDPGASTGIAHIREGKVFYLETKTPYLLLHLLRSKMFDVDRIILEDSTLTSYVYTAPKVKKLEAKLKIARNIGEVDGYCKMIVLACAEAGIPCLQVSPKGKGEKLNAAQFKAVTGWEGQTNQHERDAVMVGWPYRNSK